MPGTSSLNSVLAVNSRATFAEVLDGLSNTLMMGESSARHEGWSNGARYATPITFGNIRGAWGQGSNNITCSGTRGPIPPGTTPAGKVMTAAQLAGAVIINGWNQGELYSFHPGSCNVGLGDGSVRSLNDNTSIAIMQKLAARADGYSITNF